MVDLSKVFSSVEQGFNVLNSSPIVGIATSPIRIIAAKIVMLVSGIFVLKGFIYKGSHQEEDPWKGVSERANEIFLHGALNWVRGIGEAALSLTIIGSLGLFAYQLASPNGFAPIIRYKMDPVSLDGILYQSQ